jgi:hypothetical protein
VRSVARGPGELRGLPLPARCVGCRLTARCACAYRYHSNRTYPTCFLLHLCAVSWLHNIIMLVTCCTRRVKAEESAARHKHKMPSFALGSMLKAACGFFHKATDTLIYQIYSVIKLYMFRAVPLPIIRSLPLYIRHWYMSCSFDDSIQARTGLSCLKAVHQTCMTYNSAECTVEDS